jgi:drug/metabolite transporter (DMT)-like permease
MLFTTFIIFIFILVKKSYINEIKELTKTQVLLMICIGIILAVHFTFWVTSLKMTSVSSSVILVTAHPIIVGPISHIFFKERLSSINVIGIIISFLGIIILVYGNYGFSSSIDTLEGNILAWLGGVAAGLYILGGRHLRSQISVIPYVSIVYSVATIVLFFFCILSNISITVISSQDLLIIFTMALISGIFGHTLYNWTLAKVRASIASVALLGEPIGSSFFALIIPWINQIPSNYNILGGGIILSGIYLTTRMNRRSPSLINQ